MFTKEFERFLLDAKRNTDQKVKIKMEEVSEKIFKVFTDNKCNLKEIMVISAHLLEVGKNVAIKEFGVDFVNIFSDVFETKIETLLKQMNEQSIGDLEDSVVCVLNFLNKIGYSNEEQSIILAHSLNYILESD